jgi:hypothetical protein
MASLFCGSSLDSFLASSIRFALSSAAMMCGDVMSSCVESFELLRIGDDVLMRRWRDRDVVVVASDEATEAHASRRACSPK